MKLSFSTNAFVRYSVFEAVEKIAAAGYEGVELLADSPHLYAPSATPEDIERLRQILGRAGLSVANINANTAVGYYGREFWEPLFEPSLASPIPEKRRWRIDYTKKCVDMARALGSRSVSVTSGRMVPGTAPEESQAFLEESLRELAPYAAESGVAIGIEYEPGLLVERCEELESLLNRLELPGIGANLDLGHSWVLGEDPDAVTEALSANIFHVHIEDIRSRKHYHLIPGLGDMDFGRAFKSLARNGYTGFVTVELYTYPHMPEEAARRAHARLKAFL